MRTDEHADRTMRDADMPHSPGTQLNVAKANIDRTFEHGIAMADSCARLFPYRLHIEHPVP